MGKGRADVSVVIVAGGSGTRMKRSLNKPYIKVGGRPILLWTVEKLASVRQIAEIILVYRKQDHAQIKDLEKALRKAGVRRLVTGGRRRQDSVANGVRATSPSSSLVAIHDAVRPLVQPDAVRRVIARARKTGCAILAMPVNATLKRADNHKRDIVKTTVDRSGLWLAQTPQVIQRDLYLKALRRSDNQGWDFTDDAQLVEQYGHPVALVEDSSENIKITQPQDLVLAEAFLTKKPG